VKNKFKIIVLTVLGVMGAGVLSILLMQAANRYQEMENTQTVAEAEAVASAETEALILQPEPIPELEEQEPEPEPEPVFEPYDIHILMVGDNLLHKGVIRRGETEDGYNFDFEFEPIADYLDAADIAIINQEVPLAGNDRGYPGFPKFNAPVEVAQAISDAGFDVVLAATNHAYDQGLSGLKNFADLFLNDYPNLLLTGIHGSEYDRDAELPTAEDENGNTVIHDASRIPLIEAGGYTFAILNYTYGPNMETLPKELNGYLELLCPHKKSTGLMDFTNIDPQVLEDIRLAEEMADVTIVCPHWGTEYTSTPSKYQQKFAEAMVEAGADLILGAHPHVIQPVEVVTSENGNSALCYYSLGNYVSTQKKPLSMLEAMAWVTFHVEEDGISLSLEDSCAIPMVAHYTAPPTRFDQVYLLEDYSEELAESHGIRNYGEGRLYYDKLLTWSDEILGEYARNGRDILDNLEQ
jgi:poly-gamma-glutamate synthesis protein (capsule biosynthesis protein)